MSSLPVLGQASSPSFPLSNRRLKYLVLVHLYVALYWRVDLLFTAFYDTHVFGGSFGWTDWAVYKHERFFPSYCNWTQIRTALYVDTMTNRNAFLLIKSLVP